MNTKILEYMLAIAETKSITRAAEQFYLSHPALSRHLKNIESELGAPLFTRQSDGMHLTPAGIIYMNDAQAILHIEKDLVKDLNAMRHRRRNLLRVMLDSHLHNRFVRLVLPQFQTIHPDFTLEYSICNAIQARRALFDGHTDLAIFDSLTAQTADLECLPIAFHQLLLAFPPDYTGTPDTDGLRQAIGSGMFIMLYPVGTTARTIAEQQLAACQIYPTKILEGFVQNSIKHIHEGGCCGILLDLFCTTEVQTKIRIGEPFCDVYTVIAYSPKSILSATAQDLMQIIIKEFS